VAVAVAVAEARHVARVAASIASMILALIALIAACCDRQGGAAFPTSSRPSDWPLNWWLWWDSASRVGCGVSWRKRSLSRLDRSWQSPLA